MCFFGRLISGFFSSLFYSFEKLARCLAFVLILTCIVSTVAFMLSVGIGLGFNYCFVESVKSLQSQSEVVLLSETPTLQSLRRTIRTSNDNSSTIITDSDSRNYDGRGYSTEAQANFNITENTTASANNKTIMVNKNKGKHVIIPANGVDLIAMLTKLRQQNKNFTLKIITH